MNPKSQREDPAELAGPSGVVTTGTTGASAETESGTEGGEAPVAEKEAFLTRCDGCAVADRVRCRPGFAVFQQLQCPLPTLALRTSTDGCVVAGRIGPYLLNPHGLQKRNRTLSLPPFFTHCHGCVVADGVWCSPGLAVFQ